MYGTSEIDINEKNEQKLLQNKTIASDSEKKCHYNKLIGAKYKTLLKKKIGCRAIAATNCYAMHYCHGKPVICVSTQSITFAVYLTFALQTACDWNVVNNAPLMQFSICMRLPVWRSLYCVSNHFSLQLSLITAPRGMEILQFS